jgi:hypothetical protein
MTAHLITLLLAMWTETDAEYYARWDAEYRRIVAQDQARLAVAWALRPWTGMPACGPDVEMGVCCHHVANVPSEGGDKHYVFVRVPWKDELDPDRQADEVYWRGYFNAPDPMVMFRYARPGECVDELRS